VYINKRHDLDLSRLTQRSASCDHQRRDAGVIQCNANGAICPSDSHDTYNGTGDGIVNGAVFGGSGNDILIGSGPLAASAPSGSG
jgi:hypothetical protein